MGTPHLAYPPGGAFCMVRRVDVPKSKFTGAERPAAPAQEPAAQVGRRRVSYGTAPPVLPQQQGESGHLHQKHSNLQRGVEENPRNQQVVKINGNREQRLHRHVHPQLGEKVRHEEHRPAGLPPVAKAVKQQALQQQGEENPQAHQQRLPPPGLAVEQAAVS